MPRAGKIIRPAASREDLDKLPPTWRGEIIEGVLYAFPRPRIGHADAEGGVMESLRGPFHGGRGGPGGWIILVEPGIELPSAPEFSPDVAGWRRERLAKPSIDGPITVVPDFCCEVLSPSTRSYDHVVKRRFYAKIGVSYLWYVDPEARVLFVNKLVDGKWLDLGTYAGDEKVRVEPFDAIEIDLSAWWTLGESEDDASDD